MRDTIKVSVVRYPDREHLLFRWRDPLTDKWRCKSAGTSKRSAAERAATQLEKEIMEGQHGPAARMSWSDFRDYHERHCLAAMRPSTVDGYCCTLNVYERFHKPGRISDITAPRITAWHTELRNGG